MQNIFLKNYITGPVDRAHQLEQTEQVADLAPMQVRQPTYLAAIFQHDPLPPHRRRRTAPARLGRPFNPDSASVARVRSPRRAPCLLHRMPSAQTPRSA
jgi:hypothetical protein